MENISDPMTQTPQETPSLSPKTASDADRVINALDKINTTLDKANLNQEPPHNKASRIALVGTITWAGMKVGTGFGAKIGGFFSGFNALKRILENKENIASQDTLARTVFTTATGSIIGGGIGGTIGGLLMGLLGLKGAHKLKNPDDILKHPFNAFGIIFGGDDDKELHGKQSEAHYPSSTASEPAGRNWQTDTPQRQPQYAAQASEEKSALVTRHSR